MAFQNIASVIRGARALGLVIAGSLAFASWAQVPSQSPLLSRVSDPPPPNVMITIDDSGSMQAHYMPEGSKVINGGQVDLPAISSMSDMVDVFSGDPLHGSSGAPKGMSYGDPSSTNMFMRWMRSTDTNSIYYNPAVLYVPWVKVTQVGTTYTVGRYDQASVTAAYWDPSDTSKGSTNLTKQYDTSNNTGLSAKWCSARSTCGSSTKTYHPMLYFLLKSGQDPTKTTSYTKIDLNTSTIDDVAASTFTASTDRQCTGYTNCCAATGCTLDQERQNFANWFVYYRTRTHLMKGAMSEAINNVNGRIRIGLGTINTGTKTIDGVSTTVIKQGIRMMDTDNKTLYNILAGSGGIQQLDPSGGTPLREATWTVGQYFRRTAGTADPGSPWNTSPAASGGDTSVLACRRSYMLLTTDGYYNDDVSSYTSVTNIDGTDGTDYAGTAGNQNPLNLTPTQYKAADWYPDKTSQRLADFAMYNYVNDLQPKVDNRVPRSGDDIAFWQHLNMFTVGLGVEGNIDPDTVTSLKGNANGWPNTGVDAEKIDDLLHAGIDTHGAFFSAKDSVSLSGALSAALGSAASANRSESGVAVTMIKVTAGEAEYIPSYQSVSWTGDVAARTFPAGTELWKASNAVPTWDKRKIWTWNGSASVTFDSSMSSTLRNLVTTTTADQTKLINFLRGDKSNEGAGKPYRVRTGPLGDFVDSTPIYVQSWLDMGYDTLPGAAGYRDWINNTISKRTSGALFQGANDGMLHAFSSTDGTELYAYVPYSVLGKLAKLSDPTYGSSSNFHTDYVDGPQLETHAFIGTKAKSTAHWSDLVLGAFGAGAKGLYAIDASDLANLGSSNTLLWETGSDSDLGYVMSEFAVGMTPDGKWHAFVGNGPGSTSGHAVLMIVNLETGAIDGRVAVDSASTDNGLMGVQLIYDSNKQVVAAYAGDLKGNLWRIELSGTPTVGFAGKPLFKAMNASGAAQPISVQPTVIPHSSGGWLVMFGSGRLIVDSDQDDATTQSFYAVRDKTLAGASSASDTSPYEADIAAGTPRKSLVEQVITADTTPGLFDVTSNTVDYSKNNGWFMDLSPVKSTQRVEFPAVMLNQFVLINTISPADKPSGPCDTTQGKSAYFLLPAYTGAQYSSPVWDTNGDGKVDDKDVSAAGYAEAEGGKTTVVQLQDGSCENLNSSGGGKVCKVPHGIKSRFVQQLMTPPF